MKAGFAPYETQAQPYMVLCHEVPRTIRTILHLLVTPPTYNI